jgi:hypothetical protein
VLPLVRSLRPNYSASTPDSVLAPEVQRGATTVNPSRWGDPFHKLVDDSCDFNTHLGPHNIIFDLVSRQCHYIKSVRSNAYSSFPHPLIRHFVSAAEYDS